MPSKPARDHEWRAAPPEISLISLSAQDSEVIMTWHLAAWTQLTRTLLRLYLDKLTLRWIHWFPVDPPDWTAEDYYLLARSKTSYYMTEDYELDKFLVFTDRRAGSMTVNIAGQKRVVYANQNDIVEPTQWQYDNQDKIDTKKFRWEKKEEFEARKGRNKKDAENYYGNHNWKLRGCYADRRGLKRWYRWFDVRRGVCVFVGVWAFFVHVALLVK